MEILIGLLIIAIGSFCQSSSYVPIKKVKEWSWESFWLIQGVFAWLVFPFLGSLLGVPQESSLFDLWGAGGAGMSIFYGILWGVGGLTFGLSMRYLGVALGQSISLGTCAGFGTLLPALFAGTNLFEGNGLILLLGVCITLAGIAIIGYAGSLRAQNMSEEEKRAAVKDFALTKGLLVALLAGVMSACFALGLDAGTPIKEAALAGGVEGLYAGLPVIFLVTLGGFLTNAAYCLQQNVANKSMGDYAKGKVWGNNLVFCALAGVLWYMQFFGLEMGKSFLTESPVLLAFSWCILMALNVTFSNVWGIILKEWKGVSNKTITVLIAGLIVLIFSLVFPVAEVAGYLWQKGWAERNGGNITVNITEFVDDEIRQMKPISEVKSIGVTLPYLKGCYFYCKGTNKRMRDLARWPMENGSVIRILDDCASYVIIADEAVAPTSELPSHLSVHNDLLSKNSPYKASVHTHPIELIAMTHCPKFLEKDVATNLLWSMIPETKAFCPRGLGIIPYKLPSSVELAEATIKELQDYDVVMWEKHGVFAVDCDAMQAFDQIDVLNKSALIYIAAKNMGFEPDGMSQEQMKEMSVAFNLPK